MSAAQYMLSYTYLHDSVLCMKIISSRFTLRIKLTSSQFIVVSLVKLGHVNYGQHPDPTSGKGQTRGLIHVNIYIYMLGSKFYHISFYIVTCCALFYSFLHKP
jgi:hypothetical protein